MTTRRTRLALAAAALGAVGLLAACSGGASDSSTSSDAAGTPDAAMAAPAAARGAAQAGESSAKDATDAADAAVDEEQQAVIETGTVQLKADDVGLARIDLQNIVDTAGGQIAQDKSQADDDGRLLSTRVVLRVPATAFADTMTRLGEAAELVSTTSTSQDVTTQVIDTDVRVRTQRASIARIRLLLDRASGIREIISIEGELNRRQTDLDSLEQRQAYLADQTSLATITASIDRTSDVAPAPPAEHHHGFAAGLASGWAGLSHATVAFLTAGGAVLPFAVVVLVLGLPVWLVLRRRRTVARAGS